MLDFITFLIFYLKHSNRVLKDFRPSSLFILTLSKTLKNNSGLNIFGLAFFHLQNYISDQSADWLSSKLFLVWPFLI